jgi:hypothetical protein
MTSPGVESRRLPVLILCLVAAAILATSCGIPLDGTPRAAGGVPGGADANSDRASGNSQAYVYLVLDGRLVGVARDVQARTPLAVLRASVQPPSAADASRGLVTAIPKGTRVVSVEQAGQNLAVGLSREFENVIGSSKQQAIGQLVYAATELLGVNALTFTVGGAPVQVSSTYRGDVSEVTACDFFSLLPTADSNLDALTPDEARHIDLRRRALMARCPVNATSK